MAIDLTDNGLSGRKKILFKFIDFFFVRFQKIENQQYLLNIYLMLYGSAFSLQSSNNNINNNLIYHDGYADVEHLKSWKLRESGWIR